MPEPTCDIGLIGLAVMGENLALNIASRGFSIAVYNRTTSVTDAFTAGRGKQPTVVGCHTIEELVAALKPPRKVMLMVKAGPAVDQIIATLTPLLSPGDVIIDGGNTLFSDTERRTREVEAAGLLYVGTGVSGGEEGALKGPSLMPGGSAAAWPLIQPIFQAIAAKVGPAGDIPCCDWVGPRGAGHYVKMVHNGIEYGDMQLICEAYWLLKHAAGLDNDAIARVFDTWNRGELDSYLIEITRDIFTVHDPAGPAGSFLVDHILDRAGAKGTGKWMSQLALDLGVPSTLVTEAVYARCLSAGKEARVRASNILTGPTPRPVSDAASFVEQIRQAPKRSMPAACRPAKRPGCGPATFSPDQPPGQCQTPRASLSRSGRPSTPPRSPATPRALSSSPRPPPNTTGSSTTVRSPCSGGAGVSSGPNFLTGLPRLTTPIPASRT